MKSLDERKIEKCFNAKVREYQKLVGRGGTYGKDLDDVGKQIYKKEWSGIYSQNNLPLSKIKKNKRLYGIFNSDYQGMGVHWLSFYVRDNQLYIWDSFGRDIDDIVSVLHKQLKNQRIRFQMSDRDRNQKDIEEDCGARCLAWLDCVKEYGIRLAMKI